MRNESTTGKPCDELPRVRPCDDWRAHTLRPVLGCSQGWEDGCGPRGPTPARRPCPLRFRGRCLERRRRTDARVPGVSCPRSTGRKRGHRVDAPEADHRV
jgi:hypothetical protein